MPYASACAAAAAALCKITAALLEVGGGVKAGLKPKRGVADP